MEIETDEKLMAQSAPENSKRNGEINPKTTDTDDAMRVLDQFAGEKIELDIATSKRLLRRIDLMIMPV